MSLPFQAFITSNPDLDEQKAKAQIRQRNEDREHLSLQSNHIPPEHCVAEILEEYLTFENRLNNSVEPISTTVSPEQLSHIAAHIDRTKVFLLRPLV